MSRADPGYHDGLLYECPGRDSSLHFTFLIFFPAPGSAVRSPLAPLVPRYSRIDVSSGQVIAAGNDIPHRTKASVRSLPISVDLGLFILRPKAPS